MTLRAIHQRINMRAKGMILVAWVWCMIGIGALSTPHVVSIPSTWHLLIPPVVSMLIWTGTGLLAVVLAFTSRLSSVGLGILTIAPFIRFSSYLTSWIVELAPGAPSGDPRGWFSAQFYLAMMLWVYYIALSSAESSDNTILIDDDADDEVVS